ncbi:Zinc finger protein-likeubi-d4 B [Orchesella cincta]|uniref:Zinc finger protein-likeubi-d4 B n=1 Tax=Orchesella cincta TaxID=48709 RepID=A0A1D2N797_ORCCI|nr:Zinc finger protein-likeubi-d4 B [Orchesella cincta]
MGSSETITLNPALVQKIQNYMNDPVYRETVENAASYNARLSSERTMRLPFLDSQTGVAQNHSNLFMDPRQRLPGLREGQIYSYPSKRWRKKRRQYLINFMQPRYPVRTENKEEDPVTAVSVESSPFPPPAASIGFNEDSRDSTKDESKPEWFYDELEMPDVADFEEPDPDSDYDYEEYSSRRKKKKPPAKAPRTPASRGRRKITYDAVTDPEKPFACDICGARYKTRPGLTYHYTHSHKDKEDEEDDEMVPASPKRDDAAARRRGGPASSLPPPVLHPQQMPPTGGLQPPTLQPQQLPPQHHQMHMQNPAVSSAGMMMPPPPHMMHGHHPPPPHLVPQQQPPHIMLAVLHRHHHIHTVVHLLLTMHNNNSNNNLLHIFNLHPRHHTPQQQQLHPSMPPTAQSNPNPQQLPGSPGGPPAPQNNPSGQQPPPINPEANSNGEKKGPDNMKPRVQPSPYCDFCLGDANENKKSGEPEEMVSCSDCGRSGHPSCLQFTANMIISVKKYRWQCIECKCCSICGTSDNDDQLLFCDDCDRGYHMYCLSPPLDAPPEGSWSCTLCIAEFHK